MNSSFLLLLGGTALAGLLTSISPCPLAANIAAVSFLAHQTGRGKNVLLAGLLYALGRMFAYVFLTVFTLQMMLTSGETLVRFCGTAVHGWMGPVMILAGMGLLGMFSFSLNGGSLSRERSLALTEKFGIWSAFPLGILFALAFCPTSAAAFLATLGFASKAHSPILFPAVFGLATALPVVIFSWILEFQSSLLVKTFEFTKHLDWWLRNLGGSVFILAGIYFSLIYIWL